MQRLFIIALAICVTLAASLGVFLFVSLIPYFPLIGKVAAGVLIVLLCCVGGLSLVFAYSLAGIMLHRRRTIVHGEIVAYRNPDGSFIHLSAQHVAAGVPPLPQVTVKELPSGDPRWDAVLDLRHTGKGMHAIAKELKVPYQRVRQFLNQVEGNDADI